MRTMNLLIASAFLAGCAAQPLPLQGWHVEAADAAARTVTLSCTAHPARGLCAYSPGASLPLEQSESITTDAARNACNALGYADATSFGSYQRLVIPDPDNNPFIPDTVRYEVLYACTDPN